MNEKNVDKFMEEMNPSWRERWCGASICACMGAANCSGGGLAAGMTKKDWESWMERQGINLDEWREEKRKKREENIERFIKRTRQYKESLGD